jgi:hypothetical protein
MEEGQAAILAEQTRRQLEHFPKRLNRGIPLRERIGFKVRTGMEASMDVVGVMGRDHARVLTGFPSAPRRRREAPPYPDQSPTSQSFRDLV